MEREITMEKTKDSVEMNDTEMYLPPQMEVMELGVEYGFQASPSSEDGPGEEESKEG